MRRFTRLAFASTFRALFPSRQPSHGRGLPPRRTGRGGRGAERLEPRTLLAANPFDPSFGGGDGLATTDFAGQEDGVEALLVYPDGRFLAAGYARRGSGETAHTDFALARYRPDGSPDPTFGRNGKVTTNFHGLDDVATSVVLMPDGRIVAAGFARRGSGDAVENNLAIARYTPSGALDRTFEGDGKAVADVGGDDTVRSVAVYPDGRVLAVGNTGDGGGWSGSFVALRLSADGKRDTTFGGGDGMITGDNGQGLEWAADVALLAGGKFVVAGREGSHFALARHHADGPLDTTFAGDGIANVTAAEASAGHALTVAADGDVLVAGMQEYFGGYWGDGDVGFLAARFNPDGTPDAAFGGGDGIAENDWLDSVSDVALLPGGEMLVADEWRGVARLNSDGSNDPTFDGEDGWASIEGGYAKAVGVQRDGAPVIAGRLSRESGDFFLARLKNWDLPSDPDDQVVEARPLSFGQARSGAIDPATDVDMYRITATGARWINADLDLPSGSRLDSLIRVFDPRGNEVASSDDAPAPGEAPGTRESFVRVLLTEPGTYYVGVSASPNANYGAQSGTGDVAGPGGSYALRVSADPVPPDPDDQTAEAPTLAAGRPHDGAIEPGADVDLFKFVAPAGGQRLTFDVDAPAEGGVDARLRFFDASGRPIDVPLRNAAPGEEESNEAFADHAFAAGTYYVGVSAEDNGGYDAVTGNGDRLGGTGKYTLTSSQVPLDADDQISEAVAASIGGPARAGRITSAGDVDMFSFRAVAGQPVGIDVDRATGSTLSARVRVFAPGGEELAVNAAGPSPAEPENVSEGYAEFVPAADGTHYFGVSSDSNGGYDAVTGGNDYRDSGSKGDYTVSLVRLATDPDDQIAEAVALELGRAATGAIAVPSDVDVYRVMVGDEQKVAFDLDARSGSAVDSLLRVYDEAGSLIAESDNGAAPGENVATKESYVEHLFWTGGTFYVAVAGAGNHSFNPDTGLYDRNGGTGAYSLSVRVVPVPPDPDDQISEARPLRPGATVGGRIDERDVDMYSITLPAGATITGGVEQTEVDAWLQVFNSSGEEVSNSEGDLYLTVGDAGTYYLAVSGYFNVDYDPVTGEGDDFASTGAYGIKVTVIPPLDRPDADDQISEAKRLAAGVATAGAIDRGDDVDMYRIDVTAGEHVRFELAEQGVDALLRLFDAEGSHIWSQSESGFEHVFETGGRYYLGMSSAGNSQYHPRTGAGDADAPPTGKYTVTVRSVPPDPDDQMAEARAVKLGDEVTDAIAAPADVDVYALAVTAGKRVRFDLDRRPGTNLDSYMRLFNGEAFQIFSNDDAVGPGEEEGADSYIEYVFREAGTYYVAVSGMPNTEYDVSRGTGDRDGTVGGYVLRVS